MTSRKTLVCFHNIVAPYRIPFFESLGNLPGWETTVFFTARLEPNRNWAVPSRLPYDARFLRSQVIKWGDTYLHFANGIHRVLDQKIPDAVLVSGMGPASARAARWARARDVPCILWWGGHPLGRGSSSFLRRAWRRRFLRLCSFALTYSRAGGEYLVGLGMEPENVVPIGNATFDASQFRADIERSRSLSKGQFKDLYDKKRLGLFVGQLIGRKNVLLLPDILRLVTDVFEDFHLVLVGDGPLRTSVVRRARRLGVEGHLLLVGDLPRDQVFEFYGRATMLIHPTLFDPWSQVVNEAAAAGIPIVTTPYEGSVGDLLRDRESALVCEPDAESFSSAIVELLTNPDLGASLITKASEEIVQQDLDDIISSVNAILLKVCNFRQST